LANLSLFYLLGKYEVKPAKIFLLGSFLLGLMLLVVGASRGPLVAATAMLMIQLGVTFYLIMKSVKFWAKLSAISTMIIVPLTVYIIGFTSFLQKLTIFNRFTNFSAGGFKKEVRALQWEASWEQIKSSPAIGERIVENLYGHSPHNLFIEIQLALGLVGSFLFLTTLAFAFKRFYTEFHYRTSFVALHFLLWLYLLYGLTGISIHTSPQVWLLLAATTYASSTVKKRQVAAI
jgi:O-antigen ligase